MSHFDDLLLTYTGNIAERTMIEQRIWREFGIRGAVFVLDMANFSLITQSQGIVYYLSLIQRMQIIVRPIIERLSGHLVKFEADNCFAYFHHPCDAVNAGISINQKITEANQNTPDEFDIMVSCGIDFGDFLLIYGKDFFGYPVNRASKLGEDLAQPGEILITKETLEMVNRDRAIQTELINCKHSGINFNIYRIVYDKTFFK